MKRHCLIMLRAILTVMDLEKTMQFILEHEARFAARMDTVAQSINELTESSKKHDEQIAKHDEQIAKHDEQIGKLADLVGRLAQAEIHLAERMNQLAESQSHTDRRLDTLIDVVDKLTRRNGGTSKQ